MGLVHAKLLGLWVPLRAATQNSKGVDNALEGGLADEVELGRENGGRIAVTVPVELEVGNDSVLWPAALDVEEGNGRLGVASDWGETARLLELPSVGRGLGSGGRPQPSAGRRASILLRS